MSLSTIARKKREKGRFDTALKKGKAKAIEQVTNALFNNAVHDNNTTAQIFYLKNRDSTNSSDRTQVEHNLDLKSILTNAKDNVLIIDAQATPTNEREQITNMKQIATDTNE